MSISEPPLYGDNHFIITFSELIYVSGASGASGTYAAKIVITAERSLYPTEFLALILN